MLRFRQRMNVSSCACTENCDSVNQERTQQSRVVGVILSRCGSKRVTDPHTSQCSRPIQGHACMCLTPCEVAQNLILTSPGDFLSETCDLQCKFSSQENSLAQVSVPSLRLPESRPPGFTRFQCDWTYFSAGFLFTRKPLLGSSPGLCEVGVGVWQWQWMKSCTHSSSPLLHESGMWGHSSFFTECVGKHFDQSRQEWQGQIRILMTVVLLFQVSKYEKLLGVLFESTNAVHTSISCTNFVVHQRKQSQVPHTKNSKTTNPIPFQASFYFALWLANMYKAIWFFTSRKSSMHWGGNAVCPGCWTRGHWVMENDDLFSLNKMVHHFFTDLTRETEASRVSCQ